MILGHFEQTVQRSGVASYRVAHVWEVRIGDAP